MEILEQIKRLEIDRQALITKINLGINYNQNLEKKKINIQDYELALKKVNKELKELKLIVGQEEINRKKQEQEQYDERTKELLKQAKEFYTMQRTNIINEFKKRQSMGAIQNEI